MTGGTPYELTAPSVWAEPPKRFSFSTLQTVTACPRRWQLLRSAWGNASRFPERVHPAAVEGQIVHEALDHLSRALCRRGRPPIGSLEFQEAAAECGFWEYFGAQVAEWNSRAAGHPRAGPGFVIRTVPGELANRAVRLLRECYHPGAVTALRVNAARAAAGSIADRLERDGALSEVRLDHPKLLLTGVLDLVLRADDDATVIVDFKTGAPRELHRDQLLLYAVLWWRCTSRKPERIAVQYLDDGWEEPVSEADLKRAEKRITREIEAELKALAERPAAPRVSKDCICCPVRARCDEGWAHAELAKLPLGRSVDVEVVVGSPPTPTGFTGRRRDGTELAIVYEPAVGALLPSLAIEARVRLVDAVASALGDAVQLRPWSEVFVV